MARYLTIEDGREYLWDFDENRILLVTYGDTENIRQVEFSTDDTEGPTTWTSEVMTNLTTGNKYVQVPNEFLNGEYSRLVCYVIAEDETGQHTRTKEIFRIKKRQQPEDYEITFTDRVYIRDLKAIAERYRDQAKEYSEQAAASSTQAGQYNAQALESKNAAAESERNAESSMESALSAQHGAESARNDANAILTLVQSKGTEITNFVTTSKTELETQKNESLAEVRSVYTADLDELKGDLDSKFSQQTENVLHFKNGVVSGIGVTITFENDVITFNGTSTESNYIEISDFVDKTHFESEKNYYTSVKKLSGAKTESNCQFYFYPCILINIRTGNEEPSSATITSACLSNKSYFYINSGTTFDNFKIILWSNKDIALPYRYFEDYYLPNLIGIDVIYKAQLNSELNLYDFLKTSGHSPLITWVDDDTSSVNGLNKVSTICESLDIRCTLGCVTKYLETQSILDKLKEMQLNGFHITTHSKTHKRWYGSDGDLPMFTVRECETELIDSLIALKSNGFIDTNYFIYPGSSQSRSGIENIVKKWCVCGVIPNGNANHLYGNGRYAINRVFITADKTLNYYKEIIDTTYVNGDWLIFGTHSGDTTEFDETLVQSVLEYAIEKSIPIKTLNEAYKDRKYCYDIYDIFK